MPGNLGKLALAVLNETDIRSWCRHLRAASILAGMSDAQRPTESVTGRGIVDRPDAARLWLPSMALANCVRGVFVRDTTGLGIDHPAVLNHYPATPTCGLSWFFQGAAEQILPGEGGHGTGPVVPLPFNFMFHGPFNQPLVGRYPEPVRLMILMLLPDAFALLTGIQPGDHLNRILPADTVLNADWQRLGQAVFHAPDDDARVALIEQTLTPWWQAVRPPAVLGSHLLDDWHQGLTLRASTSSLGRSARQIERRIKQWTGQPLRELRGIGRSERAFFRAILAQEHGDVSWAALADEAGYTDQSHLCRQTRRLTGFPPEELRRRITSDEGFWLYRLWGFSEAGRTADPPRR